MSRKTWTMSITVLLLFTGAAFAQNATDDPSDDASPDERECAAEYREAQAEAKADYDEELAEAEDEQDRADARREYNEELAEAEQDYRECLADARDDAQDGLPIPESYSGRHVSFAITSDGVANYTVGDHLIFDSVNGSMDAEWEEFRVRGASIQLEGEDTELKVADAPTGVFGFEADDQRVTLVLADGLTVTEASRDGNTSDDSDDDSDEDDRDDDRVHLILQGDGIRAHLVVSHDYSYDNATGILTTDEEMRLVVHGQGQERHHERTLKGMADGRIAAQVDVPRNGRATGAEFGDVSVVVEETESGLIATVDSEGPGRTILFSLEEDALGDLGSLQVLFDGEPIGLADNMEDVLDTSDGQAEYLILVGGDGAEVLVKVPHFSIHTIELSGQQDAAFTPSVSVGATLAGVLGLAAVARLAHRRL